MFLLRKEQSDVAFFYPVYTKSNKFRRTTLKQRSGLYEGKYRPIGPPVIAVNNIVQFQTWI